MSRIHKHLNWLIAVRLGALTAVAIPLFLAQPRSAAAPSHLLLSVAFGFFASIVYLALRQPLRRRPELQAAIQFGGDLVLVTSLIWYLGGVFSPASILYLVVVGICATMLGRRAGLTCSLAAWALYAATMAALYLGWTPPLAPPQEETISLWRLAYNLSIHSFGFFAVALLTPHLAEERRLRANLADLKVLHEDIVHSIPSGLVTTDRSGRITSINTAGADILGIPRIEVLGRQIYSLGLLDLTSWTRITDSSREQGMREEVEWQLDGEPRCLGFTLSTLQHADGTPTGFVVIFQDLTGWRMLQDEVRMKDRMAAVGELAAGIAHEIGNPLAAISGSVQMLSSSVSGDSPQQKLLQIIHKESQRLDRTIKGFLQFARPKDRSTAQFDIANLLAENTELLRNSSERLATHEIDTQLDPPAVHLFGDPDQISQIFWNVSRNALRAMPDGGRLTVRGYLAGTGYRVEFADTGRGMTTEEKTNIFHPFHSFFDGGTGIGMAIVYRIVEEHGGRLTVDSRPGEGTKIIIELPVTETGSIVLPSLEGATP